MRSALIAIACALGGGVVGACASSSTPPPPQAPMIATTTVPATATNDVPIESDPLPSASSSSSAVPTAIASATPQFPGGPVFDRAAAAAALGLVNVNACAMPNQPTGAGHVTITFDPSGAVSSVSVDAGPFPGTAIAACVATKFRGATVPAFSGGPVRVGKSFTIR